MNWLCCVWGRDPLVKGRKCAGTDEADERDIETKEVGQCRRDARLRGKRGVCGTQWGYRSGCLSTLHPSPLSLRWRKAKVNRHRRTSRPLRATAVDAMGAGGTTSPRERPQKSASRCGAEGDARVRRRQTLHSCGKASVGSRKVVGAAQKEVFGLQRNCDRIPALESSAGEHTVVRCSWRVSW